MTFWLVYITDHRTLVSRNRRFGEPECPLEAHFSLCTRRNATGKN